MVYKAFVYAPNTPMRSIPLYPNSPSPSPAQIRTEIGTSNYPIGVNWFLTLPFLITGLPLAVTLTIAIASKLHHHIHTNAIARQRAYLERIWQINSHRL